MTQVYSSNSQNPPSRSSWQFSDPRADVIQPVIAVQMEFENKEKASHPKMTLSAPPQDVIQTVAVVSSELSPRDDGIAMGLQDAIVSMTSKERNYREEIVDQDLRLEQDLPATTEVLGIPQIYRIIRQVATADSGDQAYSAIFTDQHETHGLAFGLVLFTQASGRLGSVLRLMQRRDPALFVEVFGPHADELVLVTNSGSSAERLGAVAGEPLWADSWLTRFRQAGTLEPCQAAQNEEAIEGMFRPMLDIALDLGLSTDRALAMVFDRVVTQGLGAGLEWVVRSVGPVQTKTQRDYALNLLGAASIEAFQTSSGLKPTSMFDVPTHAKLVAALRQQDLIPLPSTQALVATLPAFAGGVAKRRLERLRDSNGFTDGAYTKS
jgi:hypothetical protein